MTNLTSNDIIFTNSGLLTTFTVTNTLATNISFTLTFKPRPLEIYVYGTDVTLYALAIVGSLLLIFVLWALTNKAQGKA